MLGIGGISMSSLAIFAKQEGMDVSGSDETESVATNILEKNGINIDFYPNFQKISQSDEVVFSSAIKEDNPQFQFAKRCGKRLLTRGEFLGQIAQKYEKVIAVAGSHGKTTTTAMIYQILKVSGKNPTLHLGGYKIDDGKNFVIGDREFFITEACEYCDNFLNLNPYISVVTNVEKEHMDYFKTFENQLKSFEKFKSQSRHVVDGVDDFKAKNLKHDKDGNLIFSLYKGEDKIMRLHLKICEEVNAINCIYAYRVAKKLGLSDCQIKLGLETFEGVKTRFERVKSSCFEHVILDYAHHPTEIKKAIKTAKKVFKNKRLITIFQPHTYSRTKHLLREFLNVFKGQELPIFFKTYSARERPDEGVSAKEFVELLKKYNKNAIFFENFADLSDFFKNFKNDEVVLLFLGAGDLPSILYKNKFIE